MSEASERARVVAVAKTYIGTPYHSHGRVKGVGVDCLTLLAEVFAEAGVVPRVELPHYAPDFFKHRGEELYMQGLLRYTTEVSRPPLPGDVVLWRYGRCFSHGAVVADWPHVVHAHIGRRVTLESVDAAEWLKYVGESGPNRGRPRPTKTFSFWG